MNFADKIIAFITDLNLPVSLPEGIMVMNPFQDNLTLDTCKKFYKKFYADSNERCMIIGINPGRFGGGITGIPFTDPIRLQHHAGIENTWSKKQELSSVFIYDMINAYGGPKRFYDSFYFTSISPLGFTKDNKNLNYYDDAKLMQTIRGFVIDCLQRQIHFGFNRNAAFCLGEGKNFLYLSKLNNELRLFKNIIPLSHPRFIMQYRLKQKDEYIKRYIEQFRLFC
jgi:hypothetical protein